MRYLLLILLPLMTASTLVKEKYPLIVLEQKYAQGKPGEKIEYYKIKPAQGLRVDPRKIDFQTIQAYKKMQKAGVPIKIYVIDQGTLFEGPFSPDKIMTLDGEHIFHMDGNGVRFKGFAANSAYVVGIGETKTESTGEVTVSTAWSTVVKVIE